jgi:hypothetical protein
MKTRISGAVAHQGRPPRLALLVVTLAFAAMLLSANLATALYAVYARQFGFSTAVRGRHGRVRDRGRGPEVPAGDHPA